MTEQLNSFTFKYINHRENKKKKKTWPKWPQFQVYIKHIILKWTIYLKWLYYLTLNRYIHTQQTD